MAGTFGYELDTGTLTEEEKEEIREQVKKYKKYESLIRTGDYYRLSDPFKDPYASWLFVSMDRRQALLNVVMLEMHGNMTISYVRLRGLEPEASYQDVGTGKCYYGSALMEAGLPMPAQMGEYLAYQIELKII